MIAENFIFLVSMTLYVLLKKQILNKIVIKAQGRKKGEGELGDGHGLQILGAQKSCTSKK